MTKIGLCFWIGIHKQLFVKLNVIWTFVVRELFFVQVVEHLKIYLNRSVPFELSHNNSFNCQQCRQLTTVNFHRATLDGQNDKNKHVDS